jgi:hypothetical protein
MMSLDVIVPSQLTSPQACAGKGSTPLLNT